jgi:hypothetical protein
VRRLGRPLARRAYARAHARARAWRRAAARSRGAARRWTCLAIRHDRVEGARSIAAALGRIATLTSLDLSYTDIGAQGARSSRALD